MSYDSDVLAQPTLEHYIPFSEATGPPLDYKGDLILTATGSPTLGATSLTADGETSCSFTSSDFFTFSTTGGAAAIVDDLTSDWTVMVVVITASFATEQLLIPLNAIGTNDCGLYLDQSGQFRFYNGPSDQATGIYLSASVDTHVAIRYTASPLGTLDLFLDGEHVKTLIVGALTNNPPSVFPSQGPVDSLGFTGSTSKLQSYFSALPNATISANATEAMGLNPGNARVAQTVVEGLGQNPAAVRVAQTVIEGFGQNPANARVAQLMLDQLVVEQPPARVAQVVVELLTPNATIPVDNITADDTAASMTDSPFLHVPHTYTIDETDTAASMTDSPGTTPETYVAVTVNFIDENGNPLPPITEASFYSISTSGGSPVASGFLGEESAVTLNLLLGFAYRVEFAGFAAPTTVAFVTPETNNVTVQVAPYVSPAEDQTNYTLTLFFLYVRNWLPTAAAAEGSNAWKLFYALAAILYLLDDATRAIGASERLQSSAEGQVDSWAVDFFGNALPRLPGESDLAYIARIEARFQRPYGTLTAIEDAIADYFTANPSEKTQVLVFDRQSDPALAAQYSLQPGQVAIILAYGLDTSTGWFVGSGFLGYTTRLAFAAGNGSSDTPPYPGLGVAVNAAKSDGIVPVYITTLG